MSKISSAAFADTKPHYDILDGLRGVAAFTVVWFRLFGAYAPSHLDQRINHGCLAVDFFFILSGFVIGYAYDDRWKKKMSVKDFLKRRLIRLHPMVVMGAVIGAVMFYFQGCSGWDAIALTRSMLLTATLLNALLIPATPGSEIRGLGEMYPLNGPSWSLFFEYIGNVLYALFIRKLPTRALSVLVLLAGGRLAAFAGKGACAMASNVANTQGERAASATANRRTTRDVLTFVIFNIVIIVATMVVKLAEDAVLSPQNTFFVGSWLFPLVSTPFYLVMADRIGKRGVLGGSILLFGVLYTFMGGLYCATVAVVGALIGEPMILLVESENSTTDIMNGDFRWDINVTPTPPLKSASV